jgi:glycosyltransferase involved in cell wall biosynthesis
MEKPVEKASCMPAHPVISVIIPAYDVAVSLGRCLDSVFVQEIPDVQVIVVNDGSTDRTPEVAKSYGDRIIYIEQENQGQGAARNTGLRTAQGEYVAFLDADDYWLPGFLKTCVAFLEHQLEAIAVSTGQVIKVWGHTERLNPSMLLDASVKLDLKPCMLHDFFTFWAKHDHIRTGSAVIRRRVIEEAGYQRADLRISEDLEYWGYLATYGKWGFIPESLWVGEPMTAAKVQGWQNKYRKRQRLCPTVEQWQERIVLRLEQKDWGGFQKVRGRVASSYTLAKILAGDDIGSHTIMMNYGNDMPRTRYTILMNVGNRSGWVGWKIICHLLRLRECFKAFLITKI